MSLLFRKFGHTQESLESAKQNKTLVTESLHVEMELLNAYKQPLPTLEEINAFQQRNEIILPEDYINFLLTINGGYPNYYYIPTIERSIDHFYPFNCPYQSSSMSDLLIFNKTDLFRDGRFRYVPIACSFAGDEYLMGLDEEGQYPIYFYNYSNINLIDFESSALEFVADSFTILLNLLVDYEKATKL